MVLEESLRESKCTSATITNLPRCVKICIDVKTIKVHFLSVIGLLKTLEIL